MNAMVDVHIHYMHFETSLQYDIQVHAKLKF